VCDCESPEAFFQTARRARVQHRCCECGDLISVGEQYEYVSGVWDGRGASFKTCAQCAGVRKFYVADCLPHYECPPCFGDLWQDATDYGNAGSRPELIQAATAAGYL
jgi:hypothetical protein